MSTHGGGGRERSGGGGSQALPAIHVEINAHTEAIERDFFGHVLTDEQRLRLAGALPDATRVRFTGNADRSQLMVRVDGPGYDSALGISRTRPGDPPHVLLWLVNVEPSRQRQGIGTRMLGRMAKQAHQLGVTRLRIADAARNDDPARRGVGYRAWPALGFDGPIPPALRAQLPKGLRDAHTMLDLMRTTTGVEWWAEHGTTLHDLYFHTDPGSRSWQQLRRQLGKRGLSWANV